MTLKHGDVGSEVASLQARLVGAGYTVQVDGWFGDETEKAVIRYQRQQGLMVDGIAGPATLARLDPASTVTAQTLLSEEDLKYAARRLGVQLAALKAVTEVESKEAGFLPSGRPVILFERHIMYRRLPKRDREQLASAHPKLVNQKPGGYIGGESEWRRLTRACALNRTAGIESASWGLFQIMGFHWQHLSYASAAVFSEAMHRSEGEQLEAFVRFIKKDPALHQALKARDWPEFAERYNGPAYARNQYDTRMAAAYDRFREVGRIS